VGDGNTVKIHSVNVAQTTAGTIGISAGLVPGDLVVTDGQDKLQDGIKVIPNQAPAATPTPASATRPSSAPPATRGQANQAPADNGHGRGFKP
jgi:multidrug efflux system membrane fusion protein